MTLLNNPFVTSGYIAPEYFCDRERETEELSRWLINENNVAIISTRRMGKTGLIRHCFQLDEIFHYLAVSDKPCIVAIDEFQQVAQYPEKNAEALLRTYVQHCNKAHFIFAGSQRYLMGEMFISPARPFYQSVSILHYRQ
jgi:hypothetical protein